MNPNVPYWFSVVIIVVNLALTVVLLHVTGLVSRERKRLAEQGKTLDGAIFHYNQESARLATFLRHATRNRNANLAPQERAAIDVLNLPPWDYADSGSLGADLPEPFEEPKE